MIHWTWLFLPFIAGVLGGGFVMALAVAAGKSNKKMP